MLVRRAPVLIAFAVSISFAKSQPTKADSSGLMLASLSSVLDSVLVVSFLYVMLADLTHLEPCGISPSCE